MVLGTELINLEYGMPTVTAAPSSELVNNILKRQQFNTEDNVCGYQTRSTGDDFVISCRTGQVCVFNSPERLVGCCARTRHSTSGCFFITTCIHSRDLDQCDSECFSDSSIIRCTNSDEPSCFTRIYDTGRGTSTLKEYGCAESNYIIDATLYETELDDTSTSSTSSPSSSTSPTSGQTVDSMQPTALSNADPQSGDSGGVPSTGAIVAISVCTSAVGLALIGLLFYTFRKKRQNGSPSLQNYHNPNNPPPDHQMVYQSEMGHQPMTSPQPHMSFMSSQSPMNPSSQMSEAQIVNPRTGHQQTGPEPVEIGGPY